MDIEFRRTGERRYAVIVRRGGDAVLEMSPAPGYDPKMPHDLIHYVVERELELPLGVFGQIARGGGSLTVHLAPSASTGKRAEARERRRHQRRKQANCLVSTGPS